MPEFDIPGQSTSGSFSYQEIGSAPGPSKLSDAQEFEPALDPTREQNYNFLDTFLGEMAAAFS